MHQAERSQAIAGADDIGLRCGSGGIEGNEVGHNKLLAKGELQTREAVARLHLGVLTLLGNETMVADITDDTTAVGKPTDLQTVADLEIGGRDVLDTKKF